MSQASPQRPVRVVLVDDHAMFRAGVRAELAATGAGARAGFQEPAEFRPAAAAAAAQGPLTCVSPEPVLPP